MSTQYFVPKYSSYKLMELHMEERRSRPRYIVGWPVRIEITDEAGAPSRDTGTLRDISSTGAYAYIIGHMPVGRRLRVSIKLPLGEEVWMSYAAQVIRLERADLGIGIALRFDEKRPSFKAINYETSLP